MGGRFNKSSPYLASRVDENQPEIVSTLRKLGYSVHCTHAVGQGFVDLVIGKHGMAWLAEVKNGASVPSARQFTPQQRKWWFAWSGHKIVLATLDDVLEFDRQAKLFIKAMKECGAKIPQGNQDAIYQLSLY